MVILVKLIKFEIPLSDLVMIYCQFIRCILEFNSNVWYSSITEDEADDIERVQKNACKLLLNQEYQTYEQALSILKLDDLRTRRSKLALKFGKSCLKLDDMKQLFEKSHESKFNLRNSEKYNVDFASGGRLYKSTIPTLQRMMNQSS